MKLVLFTHNFGLIWNSVIVGKSIKSFEVNQVILKTSHDFSRRKLSDNLLRYAFAMENVIKVIVTGPN